MQAPDSLITVILLAALLTSPVIAVLSLVAGLILGQRLSRGQTPLPPLASILPSRRPSEEEMEEEEEGDGGRKLMPSVRT